MRYKTCLLGEIGEIVSGATPKTSDQENFGGEIAWLTPADLSGYSDKYISHGSRNLSEKGYNSCSTQLMPAGSVLFSSRAPIGYVAIAANPICTNQGFKSIVPNETISSEFLYYQLKYLKKSIQDMGSGTTFKEVSAKKLATVKVIVPPLFEQQRIVARIEELFSQLDSGVETLRKTKQQLAAYRQAVFASVIGKYEGVSKKLSDIAVTVDGDRGKNYPKKDEFTQTGYCLFLTAANVKPYGWSFEDNTFITKEKDNILHGGRLKKNDVVITTRGTLGNVAIYDDSVPFESVRINSCMLIIRVIDAAVSPYYLAQYLMSPMFKYQIATQKSGTAQPQIPANILKGITLKIPALEDQQAIIDELTEKFSVCDSIEQTVDASLQQAEALRQSILKQAFEGGAKND